MDIKNYAEQIMQQIRTQPKASVEHIEQNMDRAQFIQLCSWILEYYGGTGSHNFLLKFNRLFLSLSVEELKECMDMMSHAKSLGVDSLIAFYGFFTNVTAESFEGLNVEEEVRRYIGKNIRNDRVNALQFRNLGLSQNEINRLKNTVSLKREKQAA